MLCLMALFLFGIVLLVLLEVLRLGGYRSTGHVDRLIAPRVRVLGFVQSAILDLRGRDFD